MLSEQEGLNNQSGEIVEGAYSSLGAENKDKGVLDHLKDGLAGQARSAFIVKVYVLLSCKQFHYYSPTELDLWHVYAFSIL